MDINFKLLTRNDFELLLGWLQSPHVKQWFDNEIDYTLNLVKRKYEHYIQTSLQNLGVGKNIHAFLIYLDEKPIGYIQAYNAYNLPRDGYELKDLPQSLASIDLFIGEHSCIGKGIGSKVIQLFLDNFVLKVFDYVFVDPMFDNLAAVNAYHKSGFKIIRSISNHKVFWMLKAKLENKDLLSTIYHQLVMREPLFHHPKLCGATRDDLTNMTREGFWEVGASGNVYNQEDVINTLLERYNDVYYIDDWEAYEFKVLEIAPGNYLMTYVLVQDGNRMTRRATLWRFCNPQWVILYHQGTIISVSNK